MAGHTLLKNHIAQVKEVIEHLKNERQNVGQLEQWEQELFKYGRVDVFSLIEPELFWGNNRTAALYSFFKARRTSQTAKVDNPSKETEFTEKLNTPSSTEFFISKFKQYLVNRKVEQAFSQIENQVAQIEQVDQFFKDLEGTFRKMFDDNLMQIEFVRSNYEFYLKLSDGRRLTFDVTV